MRLTELQDKSVLLLGLGQEGSATLRFLRARFPQKQIGLADESPLHQLNPELTAAIRADPQVRLHLGAPSFDTLTGYDVIIKSPGIQPTHPVIQQAAAMGSSVTSHTALFFANCPSTIIGVTGTKGKSTTSALIHTVLQAGGFETHLVGNMGNPA